jgi:hypothetical protein
MSTVKNLPPQHIPITRDEFKPEQYDAVPARVAETVSHEPAPLQKAWAKVAADGFVSPEEADRLQRAILGNKLFQDGMEVTNSTEAKFVAARLRDPGVVLDPEVRARWEGMLASRHARMEQGEVLAGTFKAGDKLHTLTEGIIDMPYDKFISRMAPDRWGANLAEYRGGEIKVTERDEKGRVVKQRERMVTETPLSKHLPALFGHLANDMTKVESIHYDDVNRRVEVKWEVLASDNRTTLVDMGELRFYADGNRTKVEFESEHRIDAFPGTLPTLERIPVLNKVIQSTTEGVMRDFFSACIRRYQQVAAGDAVTY